MIADYVIRVFDRILKKHKKRYERGKSIKLIGVKSLECNFNPNRRTYNPHLHIIVPNKETAEILVKEWQLLWGKKYTNKLAQFARKVEDTERDLKEIIKYGSKIFTEPYINKKSLQTNSHKIYVAALYNILKVMKGRRLFDRFGFNLPKTTTNCGKISLLDECDIWTYNSFLLDWQKINSDDLLTGYRPSADLEDLLKNNIDAELE